MAGSRAPAVVAAITVAVLAVVAFVLGPPVVRTPDWMRGDGRAAPQPTAVPDATASPDPAESLEPGETVTSLDIAVPWPLLVVVALLVLAWFGSGLRRTVVGRFGGSRVVGGTLDEVVEPDLRDAARQARQFLLRQGTPGHDAVVQAWVALETAAAESGMPRLPSETPSEFTARLLAAQHADEDATARLLRLYHHARFAAHPHLSDADVVAAVADLDTIIASLPAEHRTTREARTNPRARPADRTESS